MYYLSFLFFVGAYYLNEKHDKEINKWLLILPFLTINIIKFGAGTDYFSYNKIFDGLNKSTPILRLLNSYTFIDPGYRFVNILAGKLGLNFIVFSAIFMSVISYFTFKWIFEDSDNIYISMLLYFSMFYLYWNLSVLRQGLVLTLLTYIYFSEKQYSNKTKIVSTLIMFTFHKSAIIVPIFYLVSKFNWTRKKFIILLALSPLSRIASQANIMNLLADKVNIFSKVLKYLDYNSIKYLSVPTLQRLFFIIVLLLFYNVLQENKKTKSLSNYAISILILYLYLPTSMVIGTRVTIFGYYTVIMLIPTIVDSIDFVKYKKIAFVSILLISTVYMYNELDKQRRNSHYNQSIHMMNIETVFNQNLDHYSNPYSVDYRIERTNKNINQSSDIYKTMLQPYTLTEVNDEDEFLYVSFFDNNLKGFINTKGEVVKGPIINRNVEIYGPYYRLTNRINYLNNYTYFHISDHKTEVDVKEVEEYIGITEFKKNEVLNHRIKQKTVSEDFLEDFVFLNQYDLKPVVLTQYYYYEDLEEYAYVRLATKHTSYYMILYNDEPLVEKLYTSVTPLNHKGIIKANTHDGIDYIDKDGNVIWFEKR